jgi:hypothetical protein
MVFICPLILSLIFAFLLNKHKQKYKYILENGVSTQGVVRKVKKTYTRYGDRYSIKVGYEVDGVYIENKPTYYHAFDNYVENDVFEVLYDNNKPDIFIFGKKEGADKEISNIYFAISICSGIMAIMSLFVYLSFLI